MSSDLAQLKTMALSGGGLDPQQEIKFLKSEYVQVNDEQNGSYAEGRVVSWILDPYKSQWSVLANSILSFPITVTHASFTSASKIGFKVSTLNLIKALQLTTSSGETIVNVSDHHDLYTATKMLCDSTKTSVEDGEGAWLYFSKDQGSNMWTVLSSSCTGTVEYSTKMSALELKEGTPNTYVDDTKSTLTTTYTSTFNRGFKFRSDHCSTNWDAGSTSFRFNALVPLVYLHPVFYEVFNRPLLGTTIRLQVTLNSGVRSLIQPYDGVISMGTNVVEGSARARLFLNVVTLPPEIESVELKKLQSGTELNVPYTDVDFYTETDQKAPAFNKILFNGVVKPKRLFLMGFPTTDIYPSGNSAKCFNSILKFNDVNVFLNGQPLKSVAFSSTFESYQEFLRACAHKDETDSKLMSKAYISYDDFRNLYRINAFDLTSVKRLLASESDPVRIEVRGTRSDSTSLDYLAFVEKQKILKIKMNGSSMSVLSTQ